jgi:flagellar hook-associated protein FlgK
MAGISHVLNIAKEALLTHQLSVQVAAHNIANVDTPGYTRQTLNLITRLPTPSVAGILGGGVRGETITRQYDQFMTHRIMKQQSTLGNLQAQQEGMRVVETIFNEAPGLMLNDLLSKFWASWQDLSDNPELLATRQSVVQMGHLLHEQFLTMNSEITRLKFDIGVNLDTAVSTVNSLTRQIAQLNLDIISSEGQHKANDLRDQRDELVKELSQLLEVTYFETSNGAYTVLLSDGRPLVDSTDSWRVAWSDNSLFWISIDKDGREVQTELCGGAKLGGQISGWLEVRGELLENNPHNFLGRLDALANALIREVNQQHAQGVGTQLFGQELTGAEIAANIDGIDAALAGFKYGDELRTDGGSFDIWLYNADSSLRLSQPVTVSLEGANTLYDVANAINDAIVNAGAAGALHTSVVDNRLALTPGAGHQFAFANDTSNFLQVAGLNTFFTGYSAGTLKVNDAVANNLEFLAAARVGEHGQVFRGDNSNALLITNIQRHENVRFTGGAMNTLDGFYNSLVTEIGTRGRALGRNYEHNSLVSSQLHELRDATSGVSLDEEMANLIKFQHAYSAAAKLITTSDEMLLTLLNSVAR